MDLHTELWVWHQRHNIFYPCYKLCKQLWASCLKFQSTTPSWSVNSPASCKGSAYHGSRLWATASWGRYPPKRCLHAAKHKCCLWIQFFIFTIWHKKNLRNVWSKLFPQHVMVYDATATHLYPGQRTWRSPPTFQIVCSGAMGPR